MIDIQLFNIGLWIWIGLAAATFLALMFVTAPYGRLSRKGWGLQINSTAAWVIMESVSFFIMLFMLVYKGNLFSIEGFCSLLWLAHYMYRAFIFPFARRRGVSTMPLSVMGMAMVFNIINAGTNSISLFGMEKSPGSLHTIDLCFLIGVFLFAAGFLINVFSDTQLRNLRHRGESEYRIPHGGLFELVSCPNYLGEIVEWVGWALMTFSLAGLAFSFWTFANLAPRAIAYHSWYRKTFHDYPAGRRALIPFLW
ncbi:MAG: DUF1295 domain-containing protein [Spirochaetaceae bacterium]|nr:MAG: DUF1295 domain-containing protein [Spirochaetaceae bacterium]